MDATDRGDRIPDAETRMAFYRRVRAASEALCAPLSPEDCAAQSMEDASPAKWHLAHTSWFFETFVLAEAVAGYRPFDPEYRTLYNSYYNGVGEQFSRPQRGLLTRPGLEEVLAYRAHVDRHVTTLLDKGPDVPDELWRVVELGLHHEQQHQELVLTDVKHLLSANPLHPAYHEAPEAPPSQATPLAWHRYDGGVRQVGHEGDAFHFDNEGPRHRVYVGPFELASRPVTNGEYLAFMRDGGYEDPMRWLSDGWATVQRDGWRAPLYWEEHDGRWMAQTLAGLRPVREEEPVCHVSLYEADAFATWAGARLPTEAEWEVAAADAAPEGNFAETGLLHPRMTRASDAPAALFGDVWEWTQSAYGPYPGYQPPEGALGEYNGKFMCNQLTLRGGSCATPRSHVRATYRNFFYPHQRWQFSGLRLARD